MKTNIAVFFGGNSVEHEVSIISGIQAIRHIDKEQFDVTPIYIAKNRTMYTGDDLLEIDHYRDMDTLLKTALPVYLTREGNDVLVKPQTVKMFNKAKPIVVHAAFPIVHGTNCEDGALQGFLELLGIPYVGCDVLSSAVGMDKGVFKSVLKTAGIPVLDCVSFSSREYFGDEASVMKEIEDKIGFPLIIKPINLGSSVGISKVDSARELKEAISLACSFADRVLAERAICTLREINCSVVGYSNECEASECEEPIMHDKILSYKDKYMSKSSSKGMTALQRKLPADLTPELRATIQGLAVRTFKAVGCHGVSRIDFLLDGETDEVFVNEINTIPGSLAFYLWEASGVPYKELINRLLSLAFKRARNRENLMFAIDTNILSGAGSFGSKGAKGSKV